jgi:uncharacterized delta-60 repeat protein
VTTDFGGTESGPHLALDAAGRIYAIGSSGANFAVARYNPSDGSIDTSFDSDGKLTADFGGTSFDFQADGKLILAGGSGSNFAVARYTTSGALDTTFDSDGKLTTDFGYIETATAVAVDGSGRLIVAGVEAAPGYSGYILLSVYKTASTYHGGLDERLYAVQDANYDVTALVDTAGAAVERYQYDPYGSFTVLDANFSADADGQSEVGWVYLHQGGRYDAATGCTTSGTAITAERLDDGSSKTLWATKTAPTSMSMSMDERPRPLIRQERPLGGITPQASLTWTSAVLEFEVPQLRTCPSCSFLIRPSNKTADAASASR